jgi:hypothetical protein
LVATQFIETKELLHVQETKNNNMAVGYYFSADGPFEGKMELFDLLESSRIRYGLQLYTETIFM